MDKQYQIFTHNITAGLSTFTARLRDDFDILAGLFFYSFAGSADITLSVRVADKEVLPAGADLNLFQINSQFSRSETIWDTEKGNIPAKASTIEIIFNNNTAVVFPVKIYCLLKKKPKYDVGDA